MNTFLARYCLSFLIAILLIATPASLAENNEQAEQAKQELIELKKDIQSLQKSLKGKRRAQSKAVTQLRNAEKQIATTSKILRATERQLRKKESELKRLRKQQKNLDKNKQEQKKALASQIKSAFVSGKQEYFKMLLNQEDPEALGRMLVYYNYMNKARTEKVAKLQETLIELENIDKKIQDEILKLNILKQSKQQESKRLQNLKSKRQKLVNALSKEIEQKSEQLTELQINAQELQELIDSVREAIESIDFTQPLEGLKSLKGKLSWPAAGKRIRSYGSRLAEGLRSKGILISAQEGKPVSAIHYGRVVYADWLRGFGLLLILDHGKGYMSLYGYNQALYKDVGDWVEAGESIAAVGQSGGQQQPALYFELRYQGKPFSPTKWFR